MTLHNVGRTLSGLAFVASLLVHLSTFVPGVAIAMQYVWPLHVGALASFVVMFVGLWRIQSAMGKTAAPGATASSRLELRREFNRQMRAAVPLPVKLLLGLGMVYVVFNFVTSMPTGGVPDVRDGVYVLHNHGVIVREITLTEYQHVRTLEVRGFSGHWMFFSLVPLVFYAWVWPRMRPSV